MTRQAKEMRLVYRDFLMEEAKTNDRLAVLEADLSSSMATNGLKDLLGKRYINLGIMEAEMVGVAAGLSITGFKPYLHTFGPFASRRVYDQLFISLAYAQLDATVIGSDAGVSAEMNGGTHMPFEDLGLIRLIPKATLFEVSDDVQFKAVLEQTRDIKGLKYIRTIRKAPTVIYQGHEDFAEGFYQLRTGKDATIVASGIMVEHARRLADMLAQQGLEVGVIDLFRIKPISDKLKPLLVGQPVLTMENHNQIGGLGSAVCDLLSEERNTPVKCFGVRERFGQVGQMAYLLDDYGLTPERIFNQALDFLKN